MGEGKSVGRNDDDVANAARSSPMSSKGGGSDRGEGNHDMGPASGGGSGRGGGSDDGARAAMGEEDG
jgi:hypothetical protein